MEWNWSQDAVEGLVRLLEKDFQEVLSFKPRFNIYRLSEGIYSVNCFRRDLTVNVDMIFNAGQYKPYIYIVKFAVSPTGEGLGKLLMAKFFQRLHEEMKFDRIYLKSINEGTTKFWEKIGFHKVRNELTDFSFEEYCDTAHHVYHINIERPNMSFLLNAKDAISKS